MANMIRCCTTLILCWLMSFVLFAQTPNEPFKKKLETQNNGKDSIEILIQFFEAEQTTGLYEPIKYHYAHRLLVLANQFKDPLAKFKAIDQLLLLSVAKQNLDSCYFYFQLARQHYNRVSKLVSEGDWHYSQGKFHQAFQQYDSAAYYITSAIQYYESEKLQTREKRAAAYRLLALINNRANRAATETSIQYLRKALLACTDEVDPMLRSSIVLSLATYFGMQMKHDSVLTYIKILIERGRKWQQPRTLASANHLLGEFYFFTGQYEKALAWTDTIQILYWENLSRSQQNNSLFTRSEALFKLGKTKQAISIGETLLGRALKQKSYFLIRDVAKYLAGVYHAQKKDKAALQKLQLYKAYQDSLFSFAQAEKVNLFEKKLALAQKERDLAIAKQLRLEASTNFQNRCLRNGIGLFCLFLLGSYIYWRYNLQKAITAKIAVSLEQRLLRSQLNPHFAFNTLSSIQQFLQTKQDTDQAVIYLVSFSRLMRQILDQSRISEITLSRELETLKNYLNLQQLRYENRFTYEFQVSNDLDANKVFIPPMLIQPWLQDAIEHRQLYTQKNAYLKIAFSSQLNFLKVNIQDNSRDIFQAAENNPLLKDSIGANILKDRFYGLQLEHGTSIGYHIQESEKNKYEVILQLPLIKAGR